MIIESQGLVPIAGNSPAQDPMRRSKDLGETMFIMMSKTRLARADKMNWEVSPQ